MGPLAHYQQLIDLGKILPDEHQRLATQALDALWQPLEQTIKAPHLNQNSQRSGKSQKSKGLWSRLTQPLAQKPTPPTQPSGLYIYGDVGRGKSMLMDLFFHSLSFPQKKRIHFYAFMLDIQVQLEHWRKNANKNATDPLMTIARNLALDTKVLCFDEFHVTNIADAMILGRLFKGLFEAGVTIVLTSNWAPNDLYKNGLQRTSFLPFIHLIIEKMTVVYLNSPKDYRFRVQQQHQRWFSPLGTNTTATLNTCFKDLSTGETPKPRQISVQGRLLQIPIATRHMAMLDFADLCEKPLGAADYLKLAQTFDILILDGVPLFNRDMGNSAKRFMALVDIFYDAQKYLIIGAQTQPENLYDKGPLAFEFARTVSRLIEMQTEDWAKNNSTTS